MKDQDKQSIKKLKAELCLKEHQLEKELIKNKVTPSMTDRYDCYQTHWLKK
jgi:hypothetical protein